MGHGLDKDCTGVGCYTSEFGTGLGTLNDVVIYIVQRAATFFQAVINNKTGNLTRKIFVECENKRKKCSGTNTNDNNDCTGDINNQEADLDCITE